MLQHGALVAREYGKPCGKKLVFKFLINFEFLLII